MGFSRLCFYIPSSNNSVLVRLIFHNALYGSLPIPFKINDVPLDESCPLVLFICKCPWLFLFDYLIFESHCIFISFNVCMKTMGDVPLDESCPLVLFICKCP